MSIIAAKDGFLAYTRGNYVVAVNLSDKNQGGDIKKANMRQFGTGVFDSKGTLDLAEGHINFNQVMLTPGQAVIIKV